MNAEVRPEQTTPIGPVEAHPGVGWLGINPADIPKGEVVGLVAVAAALYWAYASNVASLYQVWVEQPDYTHGFLVLPIAAVILWKRWPGPDAPRPAHWWPGWVVVAAGLAARAFFQEQGRTWSETATLMPVLFGLGLSRMGWRAMFRVWPAFAFLIFLFPLPPQLNAALSQPLQTLATNLACGLLRLTGLWVMPEGNVILVGNEKLEVAAACNGLSMLMSLAATVAATASLVPMSTLKRVALLGSIIPIALASNVLRIAATAWCYYRFGADVGSKYAHDAAGWLMMPTAMLLVWLELAAISWLIIETEESDQENTRLGLGMMTGPASPNLGGRS